MCSEILSPVYIWTLNQPFHTVLSNRKKIMEVLKSSEYYLKITGILPVNNKQPSTIIAFALNALYMVVLSALCYMTAAFVYYHSDDIIASANAIMIFCGTFMVAAIYFFLRINRENLKELIKIFRRTVDKGWSSRDIEL